MGQSHPKERTKNRLHSSCQYLALPGEIFSSEELVCVLSRLQNRLLSSGMMTYRLDLDLHFGLCLTESEWHVALPLSFW